MKYATPIEWILDSPRLWIAAGVWVVGWLSLETAFYVRTKRPYAFAEARVSMMTFAVVSVAQVAVSLLLLPVLTWVYPYRFFTLSMESPWHWLMAWVITDFSYYWIHRALHETRIGWAFHAPHHSTRQLSLLDSLRTSWGEQPVGILAYGIPLVLLGIPPYIAGIFYFFVALFQFCVHTEIDWSLGPLSGFIYTPAAHRVHHSRLRKEADMNYGGFFVLFDRLFGTWLPTKPSDRPEVYGLPDWEPKGFVEVAFGEMRRFWLGWTSEEGVIAKLRYAMKR